MSLKQSLGNPVPLVEEENNDDATTIRQGFSPDQEPHEKISFRRQQFYIWFLFFNHISAQWQTYLFVYLTTGDDPYTNIKVDLGLTQERYAIVTGTVFTLINSIFGLLMGYLTDRFNRKWILVATTILYTLMTLACAFVHNFVQVLIPRIAFSFFMSACIPVSVSLINDYFEHEMRGRANSLFAFGIYLGGGLSSLTLILNEYMGWRHSIMIVCGINLLWAIPMVFFHEPQRVQFLKSMMAQSAIRNSQQQQLRNSQEEDLKLTQTSMNPDNNNINPPPTLEGQQEPQVYVPVKQYKVLSFKQKLKIIMSNRCFLYFITASTLRFFGGFSIGFWSPSFSQGNYPTHTTDFSIINAFVVVVGGLSSSYMGGWITDKYEDKYPRIKGQISGLGALASTIFIVITYTLQLNFYVGMASLFCAYLTAEMWYGPAHAAVNRIFPSEFQGIAIAIFTLLGSLAGAFATYLLGVLGDTYDVKSNPKLAGYLITAFVLFSYCTCCPMFLIASKEYEREIKKIKVKQSLRQSNESPQ